MSTDSSTFDSSSSGLGVTGAGAPYVRGRSLDLSYVFLRYFFETEYLHYGFWPEGLDAKFANLLEAQQLYADKVYSLIPQDVKTVLDVACGSGKNEFGLEEIENIDVTEAVAPHFDLEADTMKNFVEPLVEVLKRMVDADRSLLLRLLMFLKRKKLKSFKERYLENGLRNSAAFKQYKSYRFVLLRNA